MLNATLCATTRTICCILENYQTEDGVNVPEVLVPFMGGLTFLPYVRESKFDVKADLPGVKNKENAKKSAPKKEKVIESKSAISQSSSTTSTSTETGDKVADEIVAKIKTKGEAVRDLKSKKANQEAITKAIEELLAAKQEYKDHTGKDYIAPGTQGSSKDKKKKKEEKTEKGGKDSQKNEKSTKPTNPATLPPPPPKNGGKKETTAAQSNSSNTKKVNLVDLDKKLLNFSYVNGFQPTKEDAVIFEKIVEMGQDESVYAELSKYVNVMRWFNHMNSFGSSERASW